MSISYSYLNTGLPELDKILKGLLPGDNVVWHIESVKDYKKFVMPFCRNAIKHGQRLIYFRFSKHEFLLDKDIKAKVHKLDPEIGFETFINNIHNIIEKNGHGGFYVFDCLTDLASAWYSDQMLGNFFLLTCPYLLDVEALAYFGLFRNQHSSNAILPISETTQLFIDVYKHNNDTYVHPIKVQQRYSPTMYMLHEWNNNELIPVTKSMISSKIFTSIPWLGKEITSKSFDIWNRTYIEAENVLVNKKHGQEDPKREKKIFKKLLKMSVSRDDQILKLAEKYFTLEDLINIGNRMIGSGLIGGKSVGMLLARAILRKNYKKWNEIKEVHDSFYIGSDVFYSYLVRNGCWWVKQQKDLDIYLHNAKHARRLILTGKFPEAIIQNFSDMLNYFGQSPIIVRSSSLLEDNFGNAFSGKYQSVFCPNQGPREKCLEDFMTAIRTIYASTMSEDALRYRAHNGMLDKDEQMSLLVQRVSGNLNKRLFYPLVAGVGYSFNPFAWSEYIDSKAGVLRLVFGLGTRAVDRSDDDYTRLAALNDPLRRPEENINEIRKYSQKKVDVIDLEANQLVSLPFEEVAKTTSDNYLNIVSSRDLETERRANEKNMTNYFSSIITFENLFEKSNFIKDMKEILFEIQKAYNYSVDIEFTTNFNEKNEHKINILQCRPFEIKGDKLIKELDKDLNSENIILKSNGPVIGESRETFIDRIIYVVPSIYSILTIADRYTVARIIGKIANIKEKGNYKNIFLIGPGRWGTTTPSLGVPVTFSEIHKVSFLCEIVKMRDDLIPDVSLGTHFFNDLVEFNILYLALYPDRQETILNENFLEKMPNKKIPEIEDELRQVKNAIKIIDIKDLKNIKSIFLYANSMKQQVVCYFSKK
jgi:hypothetical protein